MHEKRRHERWTISTEVTLSSEDNFYAGATRDISVGGLFVVTPVALPIGTELAVQLRLRHRNLSLRAEVVWSVGKEAEMAGLGLRFIDLPAGAKREIEEFMKKREPIGFSLDDATDDTSDDKPGSS